MVSAPTRGEPADVRRYTRSCRPEDELRLVFLYLGRGEALGHLMASIAAGASAIQGLDASFVVSRRNACMTRALAGRTDTVFLDTFGPRSPLAAVGNFLAARRVMLAHLAARCPHAVVSLMPHVWTPLLVPAVRRAGIAYVSVVHDAVGHPGDPTALLLPWLHHEARSCDLVIALSGHVAAQLSDLGIAPAGRIAQLFLPDFRYATPGVAVARPRPSRGRLRLLFFGRLLRYKGLPLLLDALGILRTQGIEIELGVVGVGDISGERPRLEALGAEIINRWIDDSELAAVLARYEAMVLPHLECSQSAVAATAFGSGMPVIGVPVGGIAEQIKHGRTGILARDATASALADAIRELATDGALYVRICTHIRATAPERSVPRFLQALVGEIARAGPRPVSSAAPAWTALTRTYARAS